MSGVLIIQTAFLGDAVLTTPLIKAASERLRPLKVSAVLIPPGAAALGYPADPIPGLDEIIVYDKRSRDKGFVNFLKLARQLKSRRFDVAIVPHRSARSAVLAYLADVPIRVGFDQNALGFLYTHRVRRAMERHEVERNLALLDPFGGPPAGFQAKLSVSVTDSAREKARALVGAHGCAPDVLAAPSILIGIAPGSVWGTKQWLPEGFAAVMDRLSSDCVGWASETEGRVCPPTFVILGGPGDTHAAEEVTKLTKSNVINLAGKTTIPEMCAVIEMLDLFITNDTGPMHIAAALDVPIVAIFGATTPAIGFAPYTPKARIVEPPQKLACRPCSIHGPKECPEGHFRCMREIEPETVISAVQELLKK